jgi:hypothetical protein
MQQFVQGFLPLSFSGEWRTALEEDNGPDFPNLRNRNYDDLLVPYSRLTFTDRFPLTCFPKLWNSFVDPDVKFLRDKTEFNFKLKAHFLSKLNPNFRCSRLLCPHCHLAD